MASARLQGDSQPVRPKSVGEGAGEEARARSRLSGGILCFDGAINRRKVAVKRIESQVRSADVVKWPRAVGRTVAPGNPVTCVVRAFARARSTRGYTRFGARSTFFFVPCCLGPEQTYRVNTSPSTYANVFCILYIVGLCLLQYISLLLGSFWLIDFVSFMIWLLYLRRNFI